MLKVTNGVNTFTVTHGAYEGIYKHQGYTSAEVEDKVVTTTDEKVLGPEVSAEQKFCEELKEKPLAQWNKDEVKEFAKINAIDITGTKSADDAKERIKAFLTEGNQ